MNNESKYRLTILILLLMNTIMTAATVKCLNEMRAALEDGEPIENPKAAFKHKK